MNSRDGGPGDYVPGDIVALKFRAGIIAASYFVSFTGVIVSLQILHLQSFSRRWQHCTLVPKRLQLSACTCSMGLVAVSCAHYVGNCAIVMGNGEHDLQLSYNSGLTAASSAIPLISGSLIFLIADHQQVRARYLLTLGLCGIFAGLTIVGMHYVDCLAVMNYQLSFNPYNIGGAIAIAGFSGAIMLVSMLSLKEFWLTSWTWKIISSAIVAVGIESVQFEALMGTKYRLKYHTTTHQAPNVAAIAITLLTLPICLGMIFAMARKRRMLNDHAHEIVLACVKFDARGRLMVSQEGLLPSKKITMGDNMASIEDELETSHPDFQWFYRVSHNWLSVVRLLPSMRRHLQTSVVPPATMTASSLQQASFGVPASLQLTAQVENRSIAFREGCCVAAVDLSQDLQEDVTQLGVLYDCILKTGISERSQARFARYVRGILQRGWRSAANVDIETDVELYGKSILLLIASQLNARTALHLTSRGYLFVPIQKIVDHLAIMLKTPRNYLSAHLSRARMQALGEFATFPSGVLLGCFAIKPGIATKSWDVLVQKDVPNQLPCVELSICRIGEQENQLLKNLNGITVAMCISRLETMVELRGNVESQFAAKLLDGVERLRDTIAEHFFGRAIFCSTLLQVPNCSQLTGYVIYANLLAFHAIRDVHDPPTNISDRLTYTPLSFFQCRQRIMYGGMSSAAFERQIHKEFAQHLPEGESTNEDFKPRKATGSGSDSRLSKFRRAKSRLGNQLRDWIPNISDSSVLDRSANSDPELICTGNVSNRPPFGGILVDRNITVHSETRELLENNTPQIGIGTSAWAEEAEQETQTWIDTLYATAIDHWQREGRPHLSW